MLDNGASLDVFIGQLKVPKLGAVLPLAELAGVS